MGHVAHLVRSWREFCVAEKAMYATSAKLCSPHAMHFPKMGVLLQETTGTHTALVV